MTFETLLGDGSSITLLARVLSYTVFYAAMMYLPLRLAAVAAARLRRARKKPKAKPRHSVAPSMEMETTYVIR